MVQKSNWHLRTQWMRRGGDIGICEILARAECRATGRVTIRSAVGFVQWLSDHWPFGLEWPEPEQGSRARAFFAPSSCPNGSSGFGRGDTPACAWLGTVAASAVPAIME